MWVGPAVTIDAVCASCAAQGVAYVGGSVGVLRLMTFRAGRRRTREAAETVAPDPVRDEMSGPTSAPVAT